ncbi:unannotated protein [freshwater metagenome]|uniref:Unannotated protein n=1 Tax=freshwater metagenome TaxID=449393 RepID=A0A6J6UUI5_9ZZZZ
MILPFCTSSLNTSSDTSDSSARSSNTLTASALLRPTSDGTVTFPISKNLTTPKTNDTKIKSAINLFLFTLLETLLLLVPTDSSGLVIFIGLLEIS